MLYAYLQKLPHNQAVIGTITASMALCGVVFGINYASATVPKTMRPEYKEARKAYDLAQNQNPISRFQK